MRCHVLGDTARLDVLAKDLPRTHASHRLPTRVEKQDSLARSLLQLWAQLAQVDGDSTHCLPPDRHQSLLRPLAEDAYERLVEHEVAHAQRDPFTHAESGAVCELEHCAVAKRHGFVQCRRLYQLGDLFGTQHVRQLAPALGCLEPLAGIAHNVAFVEKELVVSAQRRDVTSYR